MDLTADEIDKLILGIGENVCEICGSSDPEQCSFEVACSCWRGEKCTS